MILVVALSPIPSFAWGGGKPRKASPPAAVKLRPSGIAASTLIPSASVGVQAARTHQKRRLHPNPTSVGLRPVRVPIRRLHRNRLRCRRPAGALRTGKDEIAQGAVDFQGTDQKNGELRRPREPLLGPCRYAAAVVCAMPTTVDWWHWDGVKPGAPPFAAVPGKDTIAAPEWEGIIAVAAAPLGTEGEGEDTITAHEWEGIIAVAATPLGRGGMPGEGTIVADEWEGIIRTCPERIPSLPKKKMYWFARSREANSVQVSRPGEASYPEATKGKPEYNLHVLKSMKKKKKKKKKRGKRNKRGQGGSEDKSQEKQEVAQEHLGSVSSSYSSPLREPQAPLVPMWTSPSGEVVYGITDDPTAAEAYHWAFHEYKNKRARQELLPTVRSSISAAIEHYNPEQKKTLLNASKSIVSLSAYHDGREINQGTGIIIECDEVKNSAIILTSAWLICIKKPFDDWSHKDYAPEAKVTVHMLDDTISVCRLLYFSKHLDIALFETVGGLTIPIMPLKSDLEYGQDFCVLTRDINIDLICTTVKVKYLDPYEHQHNHYMFIGGSIPKCGTGGALADFSGNTVGMLFCTLPMVAFLPSSLILTCLRLWKKFGQILGLKFKTVDFQEMTLIELLSRKYNITSGLIVGEVSAECAAEKLGIRVGDIILSLSRERAFQLENILLSIGERYLEEGNDSSSKVDIKVNFRVLNEYT
uniref:PDZ domain-containing protein n=1 Tax=Oryza rufipogon TaxID=4529 RepID=A0A0E0NZ55_ORYRU